MIIVKLKENHGMPTLRTGAGIIAERQEDGIPPPVEGKKETVGLS